MDKSNGAIKAEGLKLTTAIKAGRILANHNKAVPAGLKVKTAIKAGKLSSNHNRVLR
jgi:hypothetical protein